MPRTVKVRVAVAVDENGDWYAVGWPDEGDSMIHVSNEMERIGRENIRRYWLTAELELPDPAAAEVEANVEE